MSKQLRVTRRILAIVLAVLGGLWGSASRLWAAPIELLPNGGFEEISDAANVKDWSVQAGRVLSCLEAHTGQRSLKLELSVGAAEARIHSGELRRKIKVGGVYRLSLWAKGTGHVALNVYQYNSSTFIGTEFFRDQPGLDLTGQWQELHYVYRPTDNRLQRAAFAIVLSGENVVAFLDDASFTFEPAENPGIDLTERVPTRSLTVTAEWRDASGEICADGKAIAWQGSQATVEITEGLQALAVRAEAHGAKPGVRLRITGCPETDARWRAGKAEESGWKTVKFPDGTWPLAVADREGYLWSPAGKEQACFRQVILWNEAHYGPDRCLLPQVREWGFSRGSIENFLLALYSPLPFPLADYEFILEVPAGFQLFGKTDYRTRYVLNNKPTKILTEATEREGKSYRRYRLFFPADQVTDGGTQYSVLPLRLTKNFAGETAAFYFRRAARGNFTELEQRLPVRILPPINGRQPKHVMISQYSPVSYSMFSPEHSEAVVKQEAAAGFNFAGLTISEPGWGKAWVTHLRLLYRLYRANKVRTFISSPGQFPLYSSDVKGHQPDWFLRWVKATPGARARYFQNTPPWDAADDTRNMYCPTFMLGEGAARFRQLLAKTCKKALARTPTAEILFLDYEAHPWQSPDGKGSYCFCDRCKAAFREYVGAPGRLTDGEIFRNYYARWEDFHCWQVARLQAEIKAAANSLGLKYMVYSWAGYDPFWARLEGKIDIAFVGSPGNSVADHWVQAQMDEDARFYRERLGIPQVIGQRFSYLGFDAGKDLWKTGFALSSDGFVQATSWKSQVLRIVAAYHGGVDLQNAAECVAGMPYWIGEATRIISQYEDLFFAGERDDTLASSAEIAYPNLLVLKKGHERLVLLFNESADPLTVTLTNKNLLAGQTATVFDDRHLISQPGTMTVVVPPTDVRVVHIQ